MSCRAVLALSVAALPLLAACASSGGSSGGSGGSAGASAVSVEAGDKTCDVARTTLDAGATTFRVKNTGSSTTEVYVYGRNGDAFTRIVSEVENIGPGITREMTATLPAGSYEVACKPGQQGNGIRTGITVTGGSGGGSGSASAVGYDREIELTTDGTTISGLSGGARTGERIEFSLHNNAAGARTLEVKNPSGAVAGEAAKIATGAEGSAVVTLDRAGTWTLVVEGDGVADRTATLTVS